MSTLTMHYPSVRMAIGRLGIWLAKVGRELQVRYANWNSEFRLKFQEQYDERNFGRNARNFGDFHVSEEVTASHQITFYARESQSEKQSVLIKKLFAIKGVCRITLFPYVIRVEKASVFSWDELRPEIERVALEHLTKKA